MEGSMLLLLEKSNQVLLDPYALFSRAGVKLNNLPESLHLDKSPRFLVPRLEGESLAAAAAADGNEWLGKFFSH